MKIIFIADIVGEPGRNILHNKLPELSAKERPDFVIANAENSAGGKGLTSAVANELFGIGIDVLTLGNHAFDKREIESALDEPAILRPANYPDIVRGHGFGIYKTKDGTKIAVINIMGRVYLPATDCPFRKTSELIEKIENEASVIIVDFHAEVTSEKLAMGLYLDGRVSAMIGTHTHIPTADERILPLGTAYITDAGMTGPAEGVIGMDRETVLKRFLTGISQHFVIAKGSTVMQGCLLEIDNKSGKAVSIKRFSLTDK